MRKTVRVFFKNYIGEGKSPFVLARKMGATVFKFFINGFVKNRLNVKVKE